MSGAEVYVESFPSNNWTQWWEEHWWESEDDPWSSGEVVYELWHEFWTMDQYSVYLHCECLRAYTALPEGCRIVCGDREEEAVDNCVPYEAVVEHNDDDDEDNDDGLDSCVPWEGGVWREF